MLNVTNITEWILGFILILSSFGVILAKKPVYAALSFLASLMALSGLYFELSGHFIAVMQILVYAGAILVIFMFVIVLFQDAHEQINESEPRSSKPLLITAAVAFVLSVIFLGTRLTGIVVHDSKVSEKFGTVQAIGEAIYLDFFFPFEAIILLFLISVVGAVYIAKKER